MLEDSGIVFEVIPTPPTMEIVGGPEMIGQDPWTKAVEYITNYAMAGSKPTFPFWDTDATADQIYDELTRRDMEAMTREVKDIMDNLQDHDVMVFSFDEDGNLVEHI